MHPVWAVQYDPPQSWHLAMMNGPLEDCAVSGPEVQPRALVQETLEGGSCGMTQSSDDKGKEINPLVFVFQ